MRHGSDEAWEPASAAGRGRVTVGGGGGAVLTHCDRVIHRTSSDDLPRRPLVPVWTELAERLTDEMLEGDVGSNGRPLERPFSLGLAKAHARQRPVSLRPQLDHDSRGCV